MYTVLYMMSPRASQTRVACPRVCRQNLRTPDPSAEPRGARLRGPIPHTMAARSRRLLLAAVLARMAGAQCPGSCRSNCTPAPHCGFDCCNHSGTGKHACVRGTSDSRGSGGAGHSGHGHSRTVWRDGLIDCSHTRVAQAVSPAVRHFARVTNATRTGSSYHGYWRKREAWFVEQVPRENGTVVLDLGAGAMHLRTALSQASPPMDHDLPR